MVQWKGRAVSAQTMAINALWHKRDGPGGGTRRLHLRKWKDFFRWGRIRIDVRSKDRVFARHGTTVIGLKKISANGNKPFVAVNANDNNRFVAQVAAAA